MKNKKIAVIGGGITGLTFANALKGKDVEVKVFEKETQLGGKCTSFFETTKEASFVFDVGGHWLHAQNQPEITKMFKELTEHERKAFVSMPEGLVGFPVQANYTAGVSNKIAERIDQEILGIVEADNGDVATVSNYDEMLRESYGETLYDLFFGGYNTKLFGMEDLSAINVGKFTLTRNVRLDNKSGYNSTFEYPKRGKGINNLIYQLSEKAEYETNSEVVAIDVKKKQLTFKNGRTYTYDVLVSTAPLKSLLGRLENANKKITKHGKNLMSSKGLIFNLGVKRKTSHIGKTWVYEPSKERQYYRVGFYSNVDKRLATKGYTGMYVECDTREQVSLDDIVAELIADGYLDDPSDVIVNQRIDLDHNYCFKYEHGESIHEYLNKKDIHSIGRYGSWHWSSMHEDMLQALELAQKVVENVEKTTTTKIK